MTDNNVANRTMDALQRGELQSVDALRVKVTDISSWQEIQSYYITNRAEGSLVSIFDSDEGRQQERVGLWLTDSLQPTGVVRNPQIYETGKRRELTDLLLSYDLGAFLFESKTLSITSRQTLPTWAKLKRDTAKGVAKATNQLVGGLKNLRRNHLVTDLTGKQVRVELNYPPHAIVLVPDLSLLAGA